MKKKSITLATTTLLALLFTGCANQTLALKENNFILSLNEQNQLKYEIEKKSLHYNFDSCVSKGYKIDSLKNYDGVDIETATLKTGCAWNGLSRGYYVNNFQETQKIKSMKLLERFDIENFEFSQYFNKYL